LAAVPTTRRSRPRATTGSCLGPERIERRTPSLYRPEARVADGPKGVPIAELRRQVVLAGHGRREPCLLFADPVEREHCRPTRRVIAMTAARGARAL